MLRGMLLMTFAAAASAQPDPKKALKRYTIDLDKAPEDRFTEVVQDHLSYIKTMLALLKVMFKGDAVHQLINATVFTDEYRREMQGVADLVGGTLEDSIMANMFYELSAVQGADLPAEWKDVMARSCTGIVAQNSNGTVMHGRNQDYPPPFSPLQFDGIFTKGGKVVYEATTFAGTVGVGGTCMVPGGWSASIDARDANSPPFAEQMKYAAAGASLFPFLLRDACARGGDFSSAVSYISATPMVNPGYFIVAGAAPGEGAIVTRNSTADGTDVLRLSDGYPKGGKPWFLVETNYDHWEAAPASDDRRDSAIKLVGAIGQDNVDLNAIWGVLSDTGKGSGTRGVYNQATIHTELIVPATGEYHTYLRHNII